MLFRPPTFGGVSRTIYFLWWDTAGGRGRGRCGDLTPIGHGRSHGGEADAAAAGAAAAANATGGEGGEANAAAATGAAVAANATGAGRGRTNAAARRERRQTANARRAGGGEANAAAATGGAAAANAAGSGHGGQAPGGRQGRRRLGDEARGDKGCHGFWKRGTTCIFDVRVTNTTCPSYHGRKVMQVLAMHETAKKDKYLEACLERRRHFTPLVYSVQGVPGEETRAAEKRLAGHLAHRWKREYSEMCGYVRARMSLATARANTLLLRGARDSRGRLQHRPVFEDGAGVSCMENWRG